MAVAWFHFTYTELVKTEWLRASGEYGWLGVHVFFVISGFVIPYSMYNGGYRVTEHFGRFFAKRLVRLEPPYLVSIVVVIILWHLSALTPGFRGSPPEYSIPQLLCHVGYLNTFVGYEWLQNVYWTLGIEFQYYLFVALIYPLLTVRRPILRAIVVATMAGTPLLFETQFLVFYWLGLFTLGMLAFQYHIALLPGKVFVPAVAAVAAITALHHTTTVGGSLDTGLAIPLAGAVTALLIAFVPMPQYRGMRVFVFLGGISYSLYLLHLPFGGRVMNLGLRFSGGFVWEVAVLTMAVAVSVAAAVALNRLVELPAQRLSSRIKYQAPAKTLRVLQPEPVHH